MENPVRENGFGRKLAAFFKRPSIAVSLAVVMILGLVLIMAPPKMLFFKTGVDYAVRFMLAYLLIGFFFLFVGQRQLLFISFMCCAILSYYLKQRTDAGLVPRPQPDMSAPTLRITHFNAGNVSGDPEEALRLIRKTDADLISVMQVSPDWEAWLDEEFGQTHPYSFSRPGVGLFGLALYSRVPLVGVDTVHFKEVPVILGKLRISSGKKIDFAGIQTYPVISQVDYTHTCEELNGIRDSLSAKTPLLVFGDLQLVPWSNEVFDFREQLNLRDSRRGLLSAYPYGSSSLLDVPFDHIFYTPEFNCVYFATVNSAEGGHLGITGTYQLKYSRDFLSNDQ